VPALTRAISGAERVLAFLLFVSLLPILAAVAGIVYLLSGKAPLVAHHRVGRFGHPFWMLKFRTMWDKTRGGGPRRFIEKLGDTPVPEWKAGADPRVTSRFGRFLRKYSIDELPQLWHVLTGEMSLVGPRPITRAEWERYYGASAAEVLELKPGISGLWQIHGRNRLTYGQRRRLDVFLARHYCAWLYLRILARTVPRVVTGRDAG
jgi:lipopolysaccharide/colanic/teichoic acid biosynthesis glycosyltransferase